MVNFSDFPEELVVKIWSLLPAKSVSRLKCVQKSWNIQVKALLKTPSFVADHLHNSINRRNSTSFIVVNESWKLSLLTLPENGDVEVNDSPQKFYMYYMHENMAIFAHCDGMICLVNPSGIDVELRGLETGEIKALPRPGYSKSSLGLVIGFGRDSVSRARKLVFIYRGDSGYVAKVLTLGDDTWRDVDVPWKHDLLDFHRYAISGVCCGGMVYWLAKSGPIEEKVLCFDLERERFETVALPERDLFGKARRRRKLAEMRLVLWRDSVALSINYPKEKNSVVDVWVLTSPASNLAKDKRWIKLPLIGGEPRKVVGFSKNGDEVIMFRRVNWNCLVSYNLAEKKYRPLFNKVSYWDDHIVPYVDSFVPL